MKRVRRCAAVAFMCAALMGLAACSVIPTRAGQLARLVQGNLDEIYLGKADNSYLKLTGLTAGDVTANYESGLMGEVDFFCGYFDIPHPSDSIRAEIAALYRQIYAHASYKVGQQAVEAGEESYTVQVTIRPLNVMADAIESHGDALADFYRKYDGVAKTDLAGDELAVYEADWAQAVIAMVRAQLAHTTYRDAKTVDVRVSRLENDVWQINAEDLQTVDALILYYPSNCGVRENGRKNIPHT